MNATIVPDRIDRAQPELVVTPIPWADFRRELEALYQPPMCAPGTRVTMLQVLRELEALGVTTTADLTITLLTRMVAARPPGQSPHTLYGLLSKVRTICSYAEAAGFLRVSPFRLRKLSRWVRLPKLEGRRHLTRVEIASILALMAAHVEQRSGWAQWRSRRLQAVTAIIAYTGMRRNECLQLHVADVDLAARVIWLRPHGKRLKTRESEAPLPIPPALAPILESWAAHRMDSPFGFPMPRECPYFIPTVNRKSPWLNGSKQNKPLDRLRSVAALAGVPDVTFQMLRRSWATHAEPLMGAAMIARILRHTTTRTSEVHYRRADIANMTEAVKNFEF
jgi:integrase